MDKTLFKGTAEFYKNYRPAIPREVVNHIVNLGDLSGSGILADIGCGTGELTTKLAPYFQSVIGIDQDEDMIHQAKSGDSKENIEWIVGSDQEVYLPQPLKMVTFCRSFHWMNQYPLLNRIYQQMDSNGHLVICGDGSFWTGKSKWQKSIKEVIQHYLGEQRRAGGATFKNTNEPYEVMLQKSGFENVLKTEFNIERNWNIKSILGCLYSTSFASQHLFGNKLSEFEQQLESTLLNLQQDGIFREKTDFYVISGNVP